MDRISKDLAIICYLAEHITDLYQTKLYKLLFYIDFLFYKHTEDSITGEIYYKLPYGPVPLAIKSRIDYVISEKFGTVAPEIEEEAERVIYEFYNSYLDAEQKQTADQRTRYIIKCKSKINLQEYVSDAELEIIDTVKNLLGNISTTDIVHKSHNEEAYTNTEMFRPIYFGFADSLSI